MLTQTRLEMPKTIELIEALRKGIAEFGPQAVVETGTNRGTGSTMAIIGGFGRNPPGVFYTIETSYTLCKKARENLGAFSFIHCLNGLSLKMDEAIAATKNNTDLTNTDLDIIFDHDPHSAVDRYIAEITSGLDRAPRDSEWKDDLLSYAVGECRKDGYERIMFCLDSAGSLGWAEFQEVNRLMKGSGYLLLLDDIFHVKHWRTSEYIRNSSEFSIVDENKDEGWMVSIHR